MTKHDHIYVPDELGFFGIRRFDDDTDAPIEVEDADKVEDVIVLTTEEALEMWNAGREVGQQEITRENLSKVTAPHFREYLQSKNITIP